MSDPGSPSESTPGTDGIGNAAAVAVPEDADPAERDALWFAFGIGDADRASLRSTVSIVTSPDEDVAALLPEAAQGGTATLLPFNTLDLLEQTPYPEGRVAQLPDGTDALEFALVAAFGVLRREPENPYNDHRGFPSARSKFPVHAFVNDHRRRRVLDVYRHALVDLPASDRAGPAREVVLAGRYTRFPDVYKWYRGALVNIELGINLRALCIGLELFGLSGRLRLPDAESRDVLVDLGLAPTWEWSLPLTVELQPADPAGVGRRPPRPLPETEAPEPILAEVVAMNRVQSFTQSPQPLGSAIPTLAGQGPSSQMSWAELLWKRSSGRVPRGIFGMNGRRRQLPAQVLQDAAQWLSVPPPGESLGEIYQAIKATVVVQAVDGYTDGVYEVVDGEIVLRAEAPNAAAELEEHYGYPLGPFVACDIRHASLIWFLSVRPREVMAQFGPGAWNTAQYACGWIAQGLSLAAAGSGLYARTVRAFKEAPSRPILGLDPDEMIVLAVVSGTPRFDSGSLLDVRL